ncbi:MAG: DUF4249 domain-containing protein [bacterium]|nr:DUF4249 domain-containing protein [bacterium]
MNYIKKISILFLLSVMLYSCEKEIKLNIGEYASKLVVNGEFNSNSTIKVEISRSIPILNVTDSTGYLLMDASAKLYENNAFIGNLTYINGFYTINYKPIQGKSYKVDIVRSGFNPAVAEVNVPATIISNSKFVDSVGIDNLGFPFGQLTIKFNDDAATNNYYELSVRYYDDGIKQWFPLDIKSNDIVFLNNTKLDNGAYVFSDVSFNGQQKTILTSIEGNTASGTPKFEISIKTFSEDYYNYLKQLRDYNNSSFFVADPIILISNVKNGLGMVGGVYNVKDTLL